jgi:hypothetical protein
MQWTKWLFVLLIPMGCSASTVDSFPSGDGGGGEAGAGGTGGGSAGGLCGGATCGTGERCYESCEEPGQFECSLGNITCGEHDMGACGCDGNAYETLCDMDEAGVRQGVEGSCEPPAGRFACGGLLCRTDDQVCRKDASPYCMGREATCSDCSCVDVASICFEGGTCNDANGAITVTCN